MFEIKFDRQAEHFLAKCENEIFERISNKMETLKQNPAPHYAKRVLDY